MGEIDFFPEAPEVNAQQEAAETAEAVPESAETPPETAEDTPEVTEGLESQTLGYSSGGIPGIGRPRGEPGKLYSDPECKHPIPAGGHFHHTYDAYGRLISFGSSEVSDAPETAESAETAEAAEAVQETQEGEEALGYASDEWSIKAGVCLAMGDRAGYERAMENCRKAMEYEMSLPDLSKFEKN